MIFITEFPPVSAIIVASTWHSPESRLSAENNAFPALFSPLARVSDSFVIILKEKKRKDFLFACTAVNISVA